MTTRYYEETPCEHGELIEHPLPGTEKPHDDGSPGWVRDVCSGGQRRELSGATIVEASAGAILRCPGRYLVIPLKEPD